MTERKTEEEFWPQALDVLASRAYRSKTARSNYLSLDCADIAFATKELYRRLSAPDEASNSSLPRLVNLFEWQPDSDLDV